MPYDPPPELAALSLADIAELAAARRIPPLDQWQPRESGDSLMRIAADGRWFHDGGEITRPAMVRAFATLLTRDAAGDHWLVTPQQKLAIAVEDAAFIAVDLKQEGDGIALRLNTDEVLVIGPDHPLRIAGSRDTPAIYVAVRHGAEARLNRSTYAQLADIALANDDLVITSQGRRFVLTPS